MFFSYVENPPLPNPLVSQKYAWLCYDTDKTSLIKLWQNCENNGEKTDGLKRIDLKTAFFKGFCDTGICPSPVAISQSCYSVIRQCLCLCVVFVSL